MRVLVVYASHYGATKGIAERIAETLRDEQLEVDLKSADADFSHLADEEYDGFVIGSAIHAGRWLKSAIDFVHDHVVTLSRQPSWLFSSGPIGEKYVHQPQPDPKEIPELRRDLDVQEHVVFRRRVRSSNRRLSRANWLEKQFVNRFMPVGDFRDWPAIEAWARRVARELSAVPVGCQMTDTPVRRKNVMEQLIETLATGLGNTVGWLAQNGVLFAIFAVLWIAFAIGLFWSQGTVDQVWEFIRGLPLLLQIVVWVLFLPVMVGLWIWETTWPLAVAVAARHRRGRLEPVCVPAEGRSSRASMNAQSERRSKWRQ